MAAVMCSDLPRRVGDVDVEYQVFASRLDAEGWLENVRALNTLIARNSGACSTKRFRGERPYTRKEAVGRMLCFNDEFGFSRVDPQGLMAAWRCCLLTSR